MRRTSLRTLFVSLSILLILLLGLALWYWYMQQSNEVALLTTPTLTPAPTLAVKGTTLTDKSNLFKLTLPANWNITANGGKKGVQMSSILAQSLDFSVRSDETMEGPFIPQYYERGAKFTIYAIRGGPDKLFGASKPITISGVQGSFSSQNSPSTMLGKDLEAIIYKDGINYHFLFTYNPDAYPQGEQVFQNILDSFALL